MRTVQKTVEGAQAQQNDDIIEVLVAVRVPTAQVPTTVFVPCRKLRKSHIQSWTGILEILMQVPATQEVQKTAEVHCKNN